MAKQVEDGKKREVGPRTKNPSRGRRSTAETPEQAARRLGTTWVMRRFDGDKWRAASDSEYHNNVL